MLRLKEFNVTPPGGFSYKRDNGTFIRSHCFRSLRKEVSYHAPNKSAEELSDKIERDTCELLKENGHKEFYFETTPSLKKQFGNVHFIDSALLATGKYFYNCGLTRHGKKLILAYRRQIEHPTDPIKNGESDIWLAELDEKFHPSKNRKVEIPKIAPNEQQEDPRIFWHKGIPYISYCSWLKTAARTWDYMPKQVLAQLDPKTLKFKKKIDLDYGMNGVKSQKNWAFFSDGKDLLFCYMAYPHEVVNLSKKYKNHISEWESPWKPRYFHGASAMNGGTPPVLVDGLYYSFFHSRDLNQTTNRFRYFVGCYAFEPKAPYRVKLCTADPLWTASEEDPQLAWAPLCVFANGAIYENGKWMVSIGVNDNFCAIAEFSHAELKERLKTV